MYELAILFLKCVGCENGRFATPSTQCLLMIGQGTSIPGRIYIRYRTFPCLTLYGLYDWQIARVPSTKRQDDVLGM